MRPVHAICLASFLLTGAPAVAQQLAASQSTQVCAPAEPDSIEISWMAPCERDGWLFDTETGCRMWDWHPDPKDKASWSGGCSDGSKHGGGVVQWTEHSQPIDRFEGTYRLGRREGFGTYSWSKNIRFEGQYADDVPDGHGTIRLGEETLTGQWHNGCLTVEGRVVAIGVPRLTCMGGEERPMRSAFQ
jgi:hypothetical protein